MDLWSRAQGTALYCHCDQVSFSRTQQIIYGLVGLLKHYHIHHLAAEPAPAFTALCWARQFLAVDLLQSCIWRKSPRPALCVRVTAGPASFSKTPEIIFPSGSVPAPVALLYGPNKGTIRVFSLQKYLKAVKIKFSHHHWNVTCPLSECWRWERG